MINSFWIHNLFLCYLYWIVFSVLPKVRKKYRLKGYFNLFKIVFKSWCQAVLSKLKVQSLNKKIFIKIKTNKVFDQATWFGKGTVHSHRALSFLFLKATTWSTTFAALSPNKSTKPSSPLANTTRSSSTPNTRVVTSQKNLKCSRSRSKVVNSPSW